MMVRKITPMAIRIQIRTVGKRGRFGALEMFLATRNAAYLLEGCLIYILLA
jgi:hypothetical protein